MVKKYIRIILIIVLIMNIYLTTNSYGICNTMRTDKRITAAKLTLENGQVLCNFTVSRKASGSSNGVLDYVQTRDVKSLELIFVIDTDTDDLDSEKAIVTNAISSFANLYEKNTSKLKIGIIGFDDEYRVYDNKISYKLKNYSDNSEEIQKELDKLSAIREF